MWPEAFEDCIDGRSKELNSIVPLAGRHLYKITQRHIRVTMAGNLSFVWKCFAPFDVDFRNRTSAKSLRVPAQSVRHWTVIDNANRLFHTHTIASQTMIASWKTSQPKGLQYGKDHG
jgi:hypothetical protein